MFDGDFGEDQCVCVDLIVVIDDYVVVGCGVVRDVGDFIDYFWEGVGGELVGMVFVVEEDFYVGSD